MKNINVKVTREDEFLIKIDPEVWNKTTLKSWSVVFTEVESLEDLATVLSHKISRDGYEGFIEGFGYLNVKLSNGRTVLHHKSVNGKLKPLEPGDHCEGIYIQLLKYNDDYSFETEI